MENISGLKGLTTSDREAWDKTYASYLESQGEELNDKTEANQDQWYRNVQFKNKFSNDPNYSTYAAWPDVQRNRFYANTLFRETFGNRPDYASLASLPEEQRDALYNKVKQAQDVADYRETLKGTDEYSQMQQAANAFNNRDNTYAWNVNNVIGVGRPDDNTDVSAITDNEAMDYLKRNGFMTKSQIAKATDTTEQDTKDLPWYDSLWNSGAALVDHLTDIVKSMASLHSGSMGYGHLDAQDLAIAAERGKEVNTAINKDKLTRDNEDIYNSAFKIDMDNKHEQNKSTIDAYKNNMSQYYYNNPDKQEEIKQSIEVTFKRTNYGKSFWDTDMCKEIPLDEKMEMVAQFENDKMNYGETAALNMLNTSIQNKVSDNTPIITLHDCMNYTNPIFGGAYNYFTDSDARPNSMLGMTVNGIETQTVGNIGEFAMAMEGLRLKAFGSEKAYNNFYAGLDENGNRLSAWANPRYWNGVSSYGTFDPEEIDNYNYGYDSDAFKQYAEEHKDMPMEAVKTNWAIQSEELGDFHGTQLSAYKYQDRSDASHVFSTGSLVNAAEMTGQLLGQMATAKALKASVGIIRALAPMYRTKNGAVFMRLTDAIRSGEKFDTLGKIGTKGFGLKYGAYLKSEGDFLSIAGSTIPIGQSYGMQAYQKTLQENAPKLQEYLESKEFGDEVMRRVTAEIPEGLSPEEQQQFYNTKAEEYRTELIDRLHDDAAKAHDISFVTEAVRYGIFRSMYQRWLWKGNLGDNPVSKYMRVQGNKATGDITKKQMAYNFLKEFHASGKSNYLDEVNTAFSVGYGNGSFEDYLGTKYGIKNDKSGLIHNLYSALSNADDAVMATSSINAYLVGAAGMLVSGAVFNAKTLAMDKEGTGTHINLPSTREGYDQWSNGRKFISWAAFMGNNAFLNLEQQLEDRDKVREAVNNLNEVMSNAPESAKDIQGIINIANKGYSDRAFDKVLGDKDSNDRELFTVLDFMHKLSTTQGGTDTDYYKKFNENIAQMAEGNASEEDIDSYIHNPINADKMTNFTTDEEKVNAAKADLQAKAQSYQAMEEVYNRSASLYRQILNENSTQDEKDYVEDIIYKSVMLESARNRMNESEKTVFGNSEINTHSNETVDRLRAKSKVENLLLDKSIKALETKKKELEAKELEYSKKKELTEEETRERLHNKLSLNSVKTLYDSYLQRRANYDQYEKEASEYTSPMQTLTANEILRLSPADRAFMFANRHDTSMTKAQQDEIDKAEAQVRTEQTPDVESAATEIALLEKRIDSTAKTINSFFDPMASQDHIYQVAMFKNNQKILAEQALIDGKSYNIGSKLLHKPRQHKTTIKRQFNSAVLECSDYPGEMGRLYESIHRLFPTVSEDSLNRMLNLASVLRDVDTFLSKELNNEASTKDQRKLYKALFKEIVKLLDMSNNVQDYVTAMVTFASNQKDDRVKTILTDMITDVVNKHQSRVSTSPAHTDTPVTPSETPKPVTPAATPVTDAVVKNLNDLQANVDKTKTDGDFYYIKEEDGQYHKYSRVHSQIGSNYTGPQSKGGSPALTRGQTIDTLVRNFFNTGNIGTISEDLISTSAQAALTKQLTDLKAILDSKGLTFYANNLVLYHKYADGTRIAGEVDILATDKDGNYYIYDLKTSAVSFHNENFRGSGINTFDWTMHHEDGTVTPISYDEINSVYQQAKGYKFSYDYSTKIQYTKQLSAYQNLFMSMMPGSTIKGLGILPVVVAFDNSNPTKVTGVVKEKAIPITYMSNNGVPLESTTKPESSSTLTVDTSAEATVYDKSYSAAEAAISNILANNPPIDAFIETLQQTIHKYTVVMTTTEQTEEQKQYCQAKIDASKKALKEAEERKKSEKSESKADEDEAKSEIPTETKTPLDIQTTPDGAVIPPSVDAVVASMGTPVYESKNDDIEPPVDGADTSSNLSSENLNGNYFFGYTVREGHNRLKVLTTRTGTNESSKAFYNWLETTNTKLQEIIDYELTRIRKEKPNVKVHYITTNTNTALDNHVVLAIEFDSVAQKYHKAERNGVITIQDKPYLVIGTLGYKGDSQKFNFGVIRKDLDDNKTDFFAKNPTEEYYMSDISTEITPDPMIGYPTEALPGDELKARSIIELINDPTGRRNPYNLKLKDLHFGIQRSAMSDEPFLVIGSDIDHFSPTRVMANSGGVFVMIPNGEGKYFPIKMIPALYENLNESKLKSEIDALVDQLSSTDYKTRLEALKDLAVNYFVLFEEKRDGGSNGQPNILVGNEKLNKISITDAYGNVTAEFIPGATFDRQAFYNAIKNAHFLININSAILDTESTVRLEKYAEAGALQTELAVLGTCNTKFSVYPADRRGILKPENPAVPNYAPTTPTAEWKSVIMQGNKYFVNGNDIEVHNSRGERIRVTDPNLIEKVKANLWIEENNVAPIYSHKGLDYYTNGIEVYARSQDKNHLITIYRDAKAQAIIERAKQLVEQQKKAEAAAKALEAETPIETPKAEVNETPTPVEATPANTSQVIAENMGITVTPTTPNGYMTSRTEANATKVFGAKESSQTFTRPDGAKLEVVEYANGRTMQMTLTNGDTLMQGFTKDGQSWGNPLFSISMDSSEIGQLTGNGTLLAINEGDLLSKFNVPSATPTLQSTAESNTPANNSVQSEQKSQAEVLQDSENIITFAKKIRSVKSEDRRAIMDFRAAVKEAGWVDFPTNIDLIEPYLQNKGISTLNVDLQVIAEQIRNKCIK